MFSIKEVKITEWCFLSVIKRILNLKMKKTALLAFVFLNAVLTFGSRLPVKGYVDPYVYESENLDGFIGDFSSVYANEENFQSGTQQKMNLMYVYGNCSYCDPLAVQEAALGDDGVAVYNECLQEYTINGIHDCPDHEACPRYNESPLNGPVGEFWPLLFFTLFYVFILFVKKKSITSLH